jgi:hypothetical protein
MRRWVADTSPLLFLAKLNRLDLLRHAADEILAPPAVFQEIRRIPDEASDRLEAARLDWLHVHPVSDLALVDVLQADLDLGESEVIALAQEIRAERVVLDDLDARRRARRIGLLPIGTLGLLLAGRLRGEIPSLRFEIAQLEKEGFRVQKALVEAVLQEAGEQDEDISPSAHPL